VEEEVGTGVEVLVIAVFALNGIRTAHETKEKWMSLR